MITIPPRIRWAIEPAVAILFLLDCIVSEVGRNGTNLVAWLPSVVIAASIAVSRLRPVYALALAGALVIVQYPIDGLRFGDTAWPAYFGIALAFIGALISAAPRVRQVAVLGFGIVAVLIACLPYWGGTDLQISLGIHNERIPMWVMIAAAIIVTALSWLIAFGLRAALRVGEAESARRHAVAELRGTESELSMAVQRDRIAQDVHDIMAHSLSVIVAQADGARFVRKKRPGSIDQSLEAIAQSARDSLAEVRMLIETLVSEPEGHSHPSLENLDALIERMRSAGVAVSLMTFGTPDHLTSGQELAVYRIVQESLTNALKHGGSKPSARVVLDWRGSGLALNISSSPAGASVPAAEDPSSRGIYGMRERARLAGGWLTASLDDSGEEFIVTAFIPSAVATSADVSMEVAR
jgi:signal transduction histidine kinase